MMGIWSETCLAPGVLTPQNQWKTATDTFWAGILPIRCLLGRQLPEIKTGLPLAKELAAVRTSSKMEGLPERKTGLPLAEKLEAPPVIFAGNPAKSDRILVFI